ncbi:MAG: preprotein translocase subunit SecY [Gammaproteobacteria bacterium RIFCSPLOWO2_12_FULL_52_10]|nr:MAG: preprotein translocase subunit SecY [Gammaproteobacteria bacterium RIFCSPLOWO2_12_FULL_52_10]
MVASNPAIPGGLAGLGQLKELRSRLFFLLFAMFVYRICTFIPVPGINPGALAEMFNSQTGTILDMVNMFSGGALRRFSVVALGIMPYISASIILQLLTFIDPRLKELRKEGEIGRRKITQYTRYGTVVLASFQAIGVCIALEGQTGSSGLSVVMDPGMGFRLIAVTTLVTGTLFLMWLGEQITERGVGNGISMIIFAGIVAGLPAAVAGTLELARTGELNVLMVIFLFLLILAVTGVVIFVERGQRRITVNYAKRQVGRKMYAGQSSHLPLKLNMSGVIPPIFASSLILFPTTLVGWIGQSDIPALRWFQDLAQTIAPGQPLYVILYAAGIVFFCFFYTAIVFDPKETAENLKKSGAFVPGMRPGEQTAKYLDTVLTKLTLAGAIYITIVCLLPELLILEYNVPFYFGGTSLLIVVVVVMDFMSQVQAHLMSHQYEGLLKKANLKAYSRRS